MTDQDLIHQLRNSKGWPTLGNAAADRIEALRAALNEAEAERHRWRQAASIGSIHTQADLDRAAQEARAVALEEAANSLDAIMRDDLDSSGDPDFDAGFTAGAKCCLEEILALLDTPTAEALEQVRAEAYLSGWVNGSNGIKPPDFGNPVFEKAPGD